MALFKRKGDGSRPGGLGKSVEPLDADSSREVPTNFDDGGDDLAAFDDEDVLDRDAARALSDEIMSVELGDEPATKGRPGLFSRSKPKAPKGAGKASKKKAEREEEDERDLASRLSVLVEIEELPGISKADAIETARHQAFNHSERPSNCFYNVMETRQGYLIEVQEGVGRSYLPSVVRLATDNPGRLVVVPMVRRKLTIVYSPRTDSFDAQILPEDVEAPDLNGEKPLVATRGPVMTPVFKQHQQWLVAGMVTAGIGAFALMASLLFYAFDPGSKVPPEWRTTNVAQVPIMQWQRLQNDASDSYVVRMEYTDGQWRVVRQTTFAQVEVSDTGEEMDSGPIVGGEVRGPSAPDGVSVSPMPAEPVWGAPNASPPPPPAGMMQP